jgi:addiction module HigA family antidote
MKRKGRPSTPGQIIKGLVLAEVKITQAEFARRLGVSSRTMSDLINDRQAITPEMAISLSELAGSTPAFWLRLQQKVDTWDVEHRNIATRKKIKPLRKSELRAVHGI